MMKPSAKDVTGERASELSAWCSEAVETLRERCGHSNRAAREWWDGEADPPEEIESAPRDREDMDGFADRLQQEGYEWAGRAGELYAEEYLSGEHDIEATVEVERFNPADDTDGPFTRDDDFRRLPAVSLRFEFNEQLIEFLKRTLSRMRNSRGGRGRPLSKMAWAYGWSKATGRWWVESTYWDGFRQALLDKGVTLTGSLAHPRKDRPGFGFISREQKWDSKRCEWR